jgi:hypothetical protein
MDSKRISIRKITVTAIMSAISTVLMFLEFSIPIVPSFLKFDFSDLPAVITSFSLGPVWGVYRGTAQKPDTSARHSPSRRRRAGKLHQSARSSYFRRGLCINSKKTEKRGYRFS